MATMPTWLQKFLFPMETLKLIIVEREELEHTLNARVKIIGTVHF